MSRKWVSYTKRQSVKLLIDVKCLMRQGLALTDEIRESGVTIDRHTMTPVMSINCIDNIRDNRNRVKKLRHFKNACTNSTAVLDNIDNMLDYVEHIEQLKPLLVETGLLKQSKYIHGFHSYFKVMEEILTRLNDKSATISQHEYGEYIKIVESLKTIISEDLNNKVTFYDGSNIVGVDIDEWYKLTESSKHFLRQIEGFIEITRGNIVKGVSIAMFWIITDKVKKILSAIKF